MIVGIAGKMGSGKDTAAEFLIKKKGYKRYAFADDLKKMCMKIFNLSHKDCYDEKQKFRKLSPEIEFNSKHAEEILQWAAVKHEWKITKKVIDTMQHVLNQKEVFKTPRHILQYVGTEVCRNVFHPDYHAIVTKSQINQDKVENVVICDVRFPNEREFIKNWGGIVCLVTGRENKTDDDASKHASETSLGRPEEYSRVINNTGTLKELENATLNLIDVFPHTG